MVKEFSAISELKSIREQKSRLSEREQELIKPILSDLNIIPVIYKWYCEVVGNCGLPERRAGASFRQKFIFIILFLYSPSTLAGGRLQRGFVIYLPVYWALKLRQEFLTFALMSYFTITIIRIIVQI